jgi:hypothetical protein
MSTTSTPLVRPGPIPWTEQARASAAGAPILRDVDVENLPAPSFLVDGVLEQHGFAMLYGDAGIGKSFICLDMAFCVAMDLPWLGRAVKRAKVLYCAAEAAWQFGPRIQAWKQAHGSAGTVSDVGLWREPLDLLKGPGLLPALIKRHGISLVFIDTLAASMVGGDEDSAKDIGLVDRSVLQMRNAGAAVVLVHHSGKKAGSTYRGSSALHAAVDTEIKAQKSGSGLVLRCGKQRNAPEFAPIPLQLRSVSLPNGRESCIVEQPTSTASLTSADSPWPDWVLPMLRLMHDYPGATTGKLRELSRQPEQTFNRRLKQMREWGLASEVPVGRQKLNQLTPEGAAVLARDAVATGAAPK